jgi:hypothetical protein
VRLHRIHAEHRAAGEFASDEADLREPLAKPNPTVFFPNGIEADRRVMGYIGTAKGSV